MKRTLLGIMTLAVWAGAGAASAQVELTWSLVHHRTVLMEPVRATVRIANRSGRALDLTPRGNARLFFDVEDQPSSTVAETGKPLLAQPVIVPDGEIRDVDVNLLDAYRLVKGQSYMLTPVLEFAGQRFFGRRLSLEIQPGLELARRDCGLSAAGTARTVSLRLIHRDRSDRLFLRIDDTATGYCLGVYDLGRVIRFFAPRLEQDAAGAFHVLHQTGPDRFAHSVFGYDGAPLGAAFYGAAAGRIRLAPDERGELAVQGGTPYLEDPENPGVFVGPALPPSHPYNTSLGEPAAPVRAAPAPAPRKTAAPKPQPSEKSHAGSEPVSW
ncbi:MAG: hypothetical protein AB7V22_04460 [Kiritimatiellia bacterium]